MGPTVLVRCGAASAATDPVVLFRQPTLNAANAIAIELDANFVGRAFISVTSQ